MDDDLEDLDDCQPGPDDGEQPASWQKILENVYLVDQSRTKNGRLDRKMRCECELECDEEGRPEEGCGEDCINRLLMIECHPKSCPCGEYCLNQRFQKKQYADVEMYNTGTAKGWGLRARSDISAGAFVREYVGEVCTFAEFQQRTVAYHDDGRRHHYFMTLRGDQIIDATIKGSVSRFMNHSCEPNCETQKWMVNGRLRVGFFAKQDIAEGEELTFDYQFERIGEGAQECHCGMPSCSGFIGGKQQKSDRSSLTPVAGRILKKQRSVSACEDELTRTVRQCCRQNHGLVTEENVLVLSRVMVTAESVQHRLLVLDALLKTKSERCLRMFLKLQGLSLLWSWMVDLDDSAHSVLPMRILETLEHLPVMNRNILKDSKVLAQVTRWSESSSKATTPGSVRSTEQSCEAESAQKTHAESRKTHAESRKTHAEPTMAVKTHPVADEVSRQPDSSKSPAEPQLSPMSSSDSGVESPSSTAEQVSRVGEVSDCSGLQQKAEQLLEKWSGLREVYRIPKKVVPNKSSSADTDAVSLLGRPSQPPPVPEERNISKSANHSRERQASKWSDSRIKQQTPTVTPVHPKRPPVQNGFDNLRTLGIAPSGPVGAGILGHAPGIPSIPATLSSAVSRFLGHTSHCTSRDGPPIPLSVGAAAIAAGIPPPPIFANPPAVLVPGVANQLPMPILAAAIPPTAAMQPTLPVGVMATTQPAIPNASVSLPAAESIPTPRRLPANWESAQDATGQVYFYHIAKRESQWEFPTDDGDDVMMDETPPLPTEPPTDDESHTPNDTPPLPQGNATPVTIMETAAVFSPAIVRQRNDTSQSSASDDASCVPTKSSSSRPQLRVPLTSSEVSLKYHALSMVCCCVLDEYGRWGGCHVTYILAWSNRNY